MRPLTIRSTLTSIIRHRELVWEMAVRDLKGMTKGATLGYMWILLRPLIQTAAYVVIVSYVFGSRSAREGTTIAYVMYVLSGMISWQMVSRAIEEAPTLIRNRMDLVKQVIYPVETLPLTSLIVGSVGAAGSLIVFLSISMLNGTMQLSWALLPLPAGLLICFTLGLSWCFMIAGTLVKDLREINGIMIGLLVYVSPVVVSEGMVGRELWTVVQWNPLSHVVICFRDVLQGEWHPVSWAIYVTMTALALAAGSAVVTRMKVAVNEYI